MGSVIRFQDLWASSVDFRRTRGYQADVTVLEFMASGLPDGFDFTPPRPQEISGEVWPVPASEEALTRARGQTAEAGRAPPTSPLPAQKALRFMGALVLATVDATSSYLLEVTPLFVQRVETVRDHGGAVALLRVYLADVRYLGTRGALRRTSFNRRRGDGSVAPDSLRDGSPWTTRSMMVSEVLPFLPWKPRLGESPDRWLGQPQWDFGTHARALEAVGEVAKVTNTTEPCLNLDNSVSFYDMGDGKLGYAPDGVGTKNTLELPKNLFVDQTGAEQGITFELTYRPDYVRVAGGPRIATARLDYCEPVLINDLGEPRRLDEALIRELTGGQFGLEWLNRIVLQPEILKSIPGFDPRVAKLIRTQAYRLWRIPGVEIDTNVQEVDENGRPTGQFVQGPGPNTHVLPLLPRAELSGGRRLPVAVATFSFQQTHYLFRQDLSPEQQEWHEVTSELRELRGVIEARVGERLPTLREFGRGSGQVNPFESRSPGEGLVSTDVRQAIRRADPDGAADLGEELWELVGHARLIKRIEESAGGASAQAYKATLTRLFELESSGLVGLQLGGGDALGRVPDLAPEFMFDKALNSEYSQRLARDELWEAAQVIADAEAALAEEDAALSESPDIDDALVGSLTTIFAEIARERAEAQRLGTLGAALGTNRRRPVYGHENLERAIDAEATVYDPDKGIVHVSRLPGHLANENVSLLDYTSFVPQPVMVIFGTRVRPRTDVKLGTRTRVVPAEGTRTLEEGAVFEARRGESYVPEALSDREASYESWWKRLPSGVEQFALEDLGPNEQAKVLRHVTQVDRPELVELIPLPTEGNPNPGNKAELDELSKPIAEAQCAGVDVIEGRSRTLLHPWPVQCDGLVAGVQIVSRPGGFGFETRIETGGSAPRIDPGRTRTRPRQRQPVSPDSAAREGLEAK